MPLQLVGTRSRAIRRRTFKKGCKLKQEKLRASAPIAQKRVRSSSKKNRRDVQRRTRGAHPYQRQWSGLAPIISTALHQGVKVNIQLVSAIFDVNALILVEIAKYT